MKITKSTVSWKSKSGINFNGDSARASVEIEVCTLTLFQVQFNFAVFPDSKFDSGKKGSSSFSFFIRVECNEILPNLFGKYLVPI